MITIRNKSHKPLVVPLPGGKKLHLIPGKTGQIASGAGEHGPLKKLIDAGEIEVVGEGHDAIPGSSGSIQNRAFGGHGQGSASRRGGDR